ncbi:radial spoke head protein 6 homolog A isoform X1 [Cydia strobilella]|uniref:radial spoke head protein 6 homolog A isoform X1 n=1 Tax=Cydia strobilella TaxID=1100964 RepID=UPI0030045902
MTQPYMCEPELIAATENILPDLNNDLILAKNFLKQQSAATGDSLYDHMVDLVHKILTTKPPDVVDNFEQYSWGVKLDKFRPNFDLLNDVYLAPPQLATVRLQEEMYRLVASKSENMDAMDEEEQELDMEEEGGKARIADLVEHNYYFREGGYGLPASECFALFIALKMLGIKEPVSNVRFFGKIFGTKQNYYVAETDLTLEELDRRIREFEMKDMPGEGEDMEDKEEGADEHKELEGEGEAVEDKNKEPVPPKLPPVPEPTWQPPPPIPVERPGQGVNKKVYWVCNVPGEAWTCLPDVTPDQIRVARLTVRCMTGDLETEIQTFPPFEGTERNYLRAQIARIQASTSISPQGFYTFGSGEEEEDIDMEEGMGDMAFNPNPFYRGHTIKDLLDPDMTYWVHHGRHILQQGRTIWWNPNAGMDEALEEEDDEGPPPVAPETGPTLMSPLSEDGRVEGLRAWTARKSTLLAPERAVVTMRSNVWPGAVAYATDGKNSECMYIGWGLKFQPPNFSPLQLPRPQDEYPVGPEVMEMQDPSFADEEAYRIARLPPPIPELPGEGAGEGYGEEGDEEED